MPFDFKKLYMVRAIDGEIAGELALGVRHVRFPSSPKEHVEAIQYRRPGVDSGSMARQIIGEIIADDAATGVIRVRDDDPETADHVWEFVPMTVALWNQMGEEGLIHRWEDLRPHMKTDAWLHEHYNDMYRVDWWVENPEIE